MHIEALYHYPIKSLRGISVPTATLTPRGLPHDRTFMVARDHGEGATHPKTGTRYENMHISGFPQMCLFTTAIVQGRPSEDDGAGGVKEADDENGETNQTCIEITYHDPTTKATQRLLIPLTPSVTDLNLPRIFIRMHQSPVLAYAMPPHFSTWFTRIFDFPVVLAYLGHDQQRPVLGNIAPNATDVNTQRQQKLEIRRRAQEAEQQRLAQRSAKRGSWLGGVLDAFTPAYFSSASEDVENVGEVQDYVRDEKDRMSLAEAKSFKDDATLDSLTFADCAPYLLATSASLQNVSARLSEDEGGKLDMMRFRPNIVVGGVDEAWAEDYWAEMAVKPTIISDEDDSADRGEGVTLKLTANCVRCPSLNVNYATGGQDGTVLKSLQKDRRVDRGMKWSPVFGRYGFVELGGRSQGKVKVGDAVEVVKSNEEHSKMLWPGMQGEPKEKWFSV